MSLPVSQQRALDRIETALRVSDPVLISLFSTFARLSTGEEMPRVEELKVRGRWLRAWLWRLGVRGGRLTARPRARIRALILIPVALAATACALLIGGGTPGPTRCSPAATSHDSARPTGKAKPTCPPEVWQATVYGR
jgi:hypothetical protein